MRMPWIAVVVGALGCERASDGWKKVELPVPVIHVELLDPGGEPREAIRFDPTIAAGTKWTYRRVWTIASEHRPKRTITETYDFDLISTDHGEMHTLGTLRAVAFEPAPKDHDPNKHLGDTIESWRDARGALVRPSVVHTRDPDLDVSYVRPELLVIAPQEPVGVGARWHEVIDQGGARASVDVELAERDADHIRERLTYRTERTISKRPATADGTALIDTSLHALEGSVSGSSTVVIHDPDHGDTQLQETIASEVVRP
jgi:hypothetical protein